MRLLILGGTQFVGRNLAERALAAGHEVTLFHRGRTNPGLFPEAEHVVGDRDGGLAVLDGRDWDACIDVCGYVPRVVARSVGALHRAVGRYVFVSTISVYADLAVPRDEDGPLATVSDPSTEEVDGESYGALKALCEQVVEDGLGERSTIVRPGYVVGPYDHTGRFTWWVHRGARGGTMPVPASLADRIQVIDARDLADFLLRAAATPLTGRFNATGPEPPISMVDVVEEAASQAGADLRVEVVPDELAVELGLDYAALPLWTPEPEWAAWASVDVSRAIAAGLSFTPLPETVAAAREKANTVAGCGLDSSREAALLARIGDR